jgi:glycosyltransferase involved in cell wall biosynthesis
MSEAEAVKYSIVVPFFNEEASVRPLYEKIVAVMATIGEPYEMVFVDDGSRDGTYRELLAVYEKDERVNLIRLRKNFGQTPALKAGFDFARGEIIISMDGDLQHDPWEIPLFVEKMKEGYDIVSGWRRSRKDDLLTRRLPSRAANWMMSKLSRVQLHDFGTTFKAYRREIIKDIQLYGELHRFIPALASWSGASIVEIPIKNPPRTGGKSKYNLWRTVRVLLDLISIKFLLDYSTKPLRFFGLLGLLGTGSGMLIGLVLVLLKVLAGHGIFQDHGPLALMAVGLVLMGIQFLSIGLVGEMVARTYYETQKKPIYSVRERKSRRVQPNGNDRALCDEEMPSVSPPS